MRIAGEGVIVTETGCQLKESLPIQTISIEDAKVDLEGLISRLRANKEIILTKDQKPLARLSAVPNREKQPPRLGTLKGTVLYMAPDFNAPLEEFKEYME